MPLPQPKRAAALMAQIDWSALFDGRVAVLYQPRNPLPRALDRAAVTEGSNSPPLSGQLCASTFHIVQNDFNRKIELALPNYLVDPRARVDRISWRLGTQSTLLSPERRRRAAQAKNAAWGGTSELHELLTLLHRRSNATMPTRKVLPPSTHVALHFRSHSAAQGLVPLGGQRQCCCWH